MTHGTPLWTYWEGPKPPIVDLCIRSIERWNPSTKVLTKDDVIALGGEVVLKETEGLSTCFRTDLLRAWLLREFGGVWVDADTVCTGPVDWLQEVQDLDLVGCYNPHQKKGWAQDGMLATPIGGRMGSPVWQEIYASVLQDIRAMQRGETVNYGKTSVGIASVLWNKTQDSKTSKRFQHWRHHPVPWYRTREVLLKKGSIAQHEACGHWNPNACLYHLTNVGIHFFKDATEEQIFDNTSFMTFLLLKAFSKRPGIYGRSAAIVNRLGHGKLDGVEVGVLQGVNARHVLQQRKRTHLTLVDMWQPHPQDGTFRATGDYMSAWGRNKWEATFHKANQNVAFAKDRIRFIREDSVTASKRFADSTFDFVFIDGDHSYEGVARDLHAWLPKVKPGGWIGGHDYNHPREGTKYGVTMAVDELAAQLELPIETDQDFTWFIHLPHERGHHAEKETYQTGNRPVG